MDKKRITCCILLLLILLTNNVFSLSHSRQSYQSLKETILALDITKSKSQKKLSALNNEMNKSLSNEYSVFIQFLSFRIKENCLKIEEYYGVSALAELPCYQSQSSKRQLDKTQYETEEEKTQSLDDELMASLGEFDEMLLSEDKKITQTSRKNSVAGEGLQSENELIKKRSNNRSEDDTQNTDKSKGSVQYESKSTKVKNTQTKKYNRKKLDKINDDIVARQLKEAAEKEKDPVLKEKLWQEYYKYKQTMI